MLHRSTVGQALKFDAAGDFTIYKFIKALSRDEIEGRVGYERGRMRLGGVIAVMAQDSLAHLTVNDFSLGASSRWSRSKAAAPWAPEYMTNGDGTMAHNAIEGRLGSENGRDAPRDVDALKAKVLSFFRTGGDNMPAKVFPDWKHEAGMDYPNAIGAGIPQFRLTSTVKWVVARTILPVSGAV